jgi:hypothetical protein
MHNEGEARTAPSHRVLEHLQVAIGVAECRNRSAAYVFIGHEIARPWRVPPKCDDNAK